MLKFIISGPRIRIPAMFMALTFFALIPPYSGGEPLKRLLSDDPALPWRIQARTIHYDSAGETYEAEGDVTVSRGEKRIRADRIRIDARTQRAEAQGNVRLDAGDDTISGDRIDIDLGNQTGTIHQGRVFISETRFTINAERIQKTGEQTYVVEHGDFTACEGPSPDWRITASKLNVTFEGYGIGTHAILWARKAPVFYVPWLIFPVKNERQSGLLTPWFSLSSRRKGFEYSQPFFWAISDHQDATLYAHHMDYRGEKIGLEYRYAAAPESTGVLMADYLKDAKTENPETGGSDRWGYPEDRYIRRNADRYWIRGKNRHALPGDFEVGADIDYASDKDYLREFRYDPSGFDRTDAYFLNAFGSNLDDYRDPVRLNRLYLFRGAESLSFSTEIRWYDDVMKRSLGQSDPTRQELPVSRVQISKRPVPGLPLFADLDSEYAFFYAQDATDNHRLDFHPRVYYPIGAGDWLSVEPFAGVRQTFWYFNRTTDSSHEDDRTLGRTIPDAGIDLSTRLYRIFDTRSGDGDSIRHVIHPRLLFSYVPETNQDRLPDFDAVDRIQPETLLTFRVTQLLQRKSFFSKPGQETPEARYQRLARILFEQPYDIRLKRNPDQTSVYGDSEPFQPFRAEIEISPFSGVLLAAEALWSHDRHEIIANNASAFLGDSQGGLLFVEHRRQRDEAESIRGTVAFPIYDRLLITTLVEHDLYNRENIRFQAGFIYRRPCWELELAYTDDLDDRKVAFTIQLTGIGDLGSGYRMD